MEETKDTKNKVKKKKTKVESKKAKHKAKITIGDKIFRVILLLCIALTAFIFYAYIIGMF